MAVRGVDLVLAVHVALAMGEVDGDAAGEGHVAFAVEQVLAGRGVRVDRCSFEEVDIVSDLEDAPRVRGNPLERGVEVADRRRERMLLVRTGRWIDVECEDVDRRVGERCEPDEQRFRAQVLEAGSVPLDLGHRQVVGLLGGSSRRQGARDREGVAREEAHPSDHFPAPFPRHVIADRQRDESTRVGDLAALRTVPVAVRRGAPTGTRCPSRY